MTEIAVVVPVHNRRKTTLNFLQQLPEIGVEGISLKTIIVDDGSTDGTSEVIREQYPEVIVLSGDGNLWWTGAVRMGAEYALHNGYENILIMNDDLELDCSFLAELLNVARSHPNALVSSIKLNRKKDRQEQVIAAGFKVAGMFKEIETLHADEPYQADMAEVLECDLLTGSSLLIPASVFQKIGMFDNKRFPHGYGDFEFTWRARLAGFRCLVATRSRIYTEYNQNYTNRYLIKSSRKDYVRNLFNKTKYGYGFYSLAQVSYMHKPFLIGTILYIRRLLGLMRRIFMKVFLPNKVLRMLVRERNLTET
jgi:GT2 family glycosyltransferase